MSRNLDLQRAMLASRIDGEIATRMNLRNLLSISCLRLSTFSQLRRLFAMAYSLDIFEKMQYV